MKHDQINYSYFRACAAIIVQTNFGAGGRELLAEVNLGAEDHVTRVQDILGTGGHVTRVKDTSVQEAM